MSILLAQTFVVPLQFQDTMVVPEREGAPRWNLDAFYTCNVGNYKAFHFRCLTFSAFYSVPPERPGTCGCVVFAKFISPSICYVF